MTFPQALDKASTAESANSRVNETKGSGNVLVMPFDMRENRNQRQSQIENSAVSRDNHPRA